MKTLEIIVSITSDRKFLINSSVDLPVVSIMLSLS
jgi:hypothetical protein